MGRIVLHIGVPKTGSTALQGFLSTNRAALLNQGIRWSQSTFGPNHLGVPAAFTRRSNQLTASVGVLRPRDQPRLQARLRRRLRKECAGDSTVLLSSEQFSSLLRTEAEVRALADFLHDVVDDVKVIAILRRGDYWVPSAYAEAVLDGRQKRQNGAFVLSRRHLLDHHALLNRWVSAFGPSAVVLQPFLESDKADPLAIPTAFLHALGVSGPPPHGWVSPPTLARQTLSATGTELLRRSNGSRSRTGLRPGRDRELLQQVLASLHTGPAPALSPRAARRLREKNWVHTGIDTVAQCVGDRWSEWSGQPDAPIRRPPEVTEAEVTGLVRDLRREGVLRRSWPGATALHRAAVRLIPR